MARIETASKGLLLVIFIVFFYSTVASAQVELFVVSPPAPAAPREFVTLVFGIVNHQAISDIFQFEATAPEGISLVALPAPLSLEPGEEGRVFLTLFVSAAARAGENSIELTAISTTDPEVSASATAVVVVREVPEVEVIAPPPGRVEPGESATLVFMVINGGNAIDRFVLSAESRRGLELTLTPPIVELLPGESAEVAVTAAVPPEGEPGRDLIILTAASEVHPGVEDSATVALTILPPLPQAVGGVLYLEIPTDFRAAADLSHDARASSWASLEGAEVFDGKSLALSLSLTNLSDLGRPYFTFSTPDYWIELGDISARLTPLVRLSGRGAAVGLGSEPLSATLKAYGLTRRGREAERMEIILDAELLVRPPEVVVQVGGRVEFANLAGLTITLSSPEAGLGEVHLQPGESLFLRFEAAGTFTVTIAAPGYPQAAAVVRVAGEGERLVVRAADLQGELGKLSLGSLFLLRSSVQAGFAESTSSILEGRMRWELSENLMLEAESAWSATTASGETTPDLGLRAFSALRVGELTTSIELLRLGTDFPGSRRDEEGFTVQQRLTDPLIGYSFVFRRTNDNVGQDPTRPTVLEQRLRVSSLISFGEGAPSLGGQLDYTTRNSSGPPPETDRETMVRGVRLTQPLEPLTISIFEEWTHEINHVLGTDFDSQTFGLNLSLRVEELSSLFRISQITRYDLSTGLIAERLLKVLVQIGLDLPIGKIGFTLDRGNDSTSLACKADVVLGQRRVSSALRLSLPDEDEPEFSLRLEFVGVVDLPFPFISIKARVEGEAFIDENGNGKRDELEQGIGDLILRIDQTLARTDKGGRFRFPPLQPGEYELEIRDLPVELTAAVPLPIGISLEAGETEYVAIPLRRAAAIAGMVFNDSNRNGTRDEGELGLRGVRLALSGEGIERDTFTDEAGQFLFPDLLPGEYLLRLDPATLPERFEPTTPTDMELLLEPGEVRRVEFGAAEKEREIVITFQPPVADFTYSPEEPRVEAPVTFDASDSFDPDGEIVKYEWDFDDDEVTDAEGIIVEWTFAEARDYPVTLTVTDNDGYQGSATKTITVRG